MKKRLYFDTSALIKEFAPEVGSDLIDKVTTGAREGKFQIVSSIWTINEAISVIDRKFQRKELTVVEVQTIIATFSERIKDGNESAGFLFAPMHPLIIADSRVWIRLFHIPPIDAMHLYTSFIYDCDYFLIHDDKVVKRVKSSTFENMEIIDMGNENDRESLESHLQV